MVNTQYPLPPQPLHIYDIKLLDNRYNTSGLTIYFKHSRLTSKRVLFIVNSINSWCKDLVKALYCVFTVPWRNQAKNYLIIGNWCALLSIWEELHLRTRNEDPISLPKIIKNVCDLKNNKTAPEFWDQKRSWSLFYGFTIPRSA